MKQVLVNNVYSFRNRGDSAIIESTIEYVRSVCPSARIWLLSQFWKENDAYYQSFGAESHPQLWDIPMDDNKPRRLAKAMRSVARVYGRPLTSSRELYREADLLIDAGGGSLFSSNKHFFYLGLYQHLFNLSFTRKTGVPFLIYPQSIGPFYRRGDYLATRRVLKRAAIVMAREQYSGRLLDEMGIQHVVVPDTAFLANFLRPPSNAARRLESEIDREVVSIGVTVLDWSWSREEGRRGSQQHLEDYIAKLSRSIAYVLQKHDVQVWIFPQVTAGHGDTDLSISQKLLSALPEQCSPRLVTENLDASDLSYLYGRMGVFVGSRMHSCIFAIIQGTPALGLAYQPKTLGTYQLIGLRDYAFEIGSFEWRKLAQLLNDVLDNPEHHRSRFLRAADNAKRRVKESLDEHLRPYLTT